VPRPDTLAVLNVVLGSVPPEVEDDPAAAGGVVLLDDELHAVATSSAVPTRIGIPASRDEGQDLSARSMSVLPLVLIVDR
jgi:hypothetical protein